MNKKKIVEINLGDCFSHGNVDFQISGHSYFWGQYSKSHFFKNITYRYSNETFSIVLKILLTQVYIFHLFVITAVKVEEKKCPASRYVHNTKIIV